ncbi:ACP S-malonyltransferase [Nonomuraea jabiensis]|uniref:[acyl-carrier-protein] S-malonyltransferase n=1 Tax=Nonomuraea jabiensis TaxID=882448 RepID=A0A7W9L7K9_9ACTN|nr:ACP S-malonyltransferase [Nonomuraea jabiensis]MBB5773591.1 [acyl-carrier-protein] S-malonyltransferase [Nonomuraea jabiensis]
MIAEQYGIAFPGQGITAQTLRSALWAHVRHPLVARLLTTFGAADPEALDLGDTSVVQPATFAAGLAAAHTAFGPDHRPPVALGHSLGELTAAAYAGFLRTDEGFELAVDRGRLCRDQSLRRPGAMVAIVGADAGELEWLRRSVVAEHGEILDVAGLNSARQTVLSGAPEAVAAAVRIAEEQCLRAEVLPIPGGFHSPLMMDAVPAWRRRLESADFRPSTTRFVSAIDVRPHTDPVQVREQLARGLVLPVRWHEAVRTVRDLDVPGLVDAGPGTTLLKLGRRARILKFTGLGALPEPVPPG